MTSENSTIPLELRNRPRWLAWVDKNGTKVPLGSSTDPKTWASYEKIVGENRGFVLGDGIVGLDLDSCANPDTGEIAPKALEIMQELGSYAEYSPSKTGVKIFGYGRKPDSVPRCKWDTRALWKPQPGKKAALECYENARYFTVTGKAIVGYEELHDITNSLRALLARLEADREAAFGKTADPGSVSTVAPIDDERLLSVLRKMPVAKAAMAKLYDQVDGAAYGHDQSKMDFVLLTALSRMSTDEAQILRLFERSEHFRMKPPKSVEKWAREDYRKRTLEAAFASASVGREEEHGLNFDLHRHIDDKDKVVEVKVPIPVGKVEGRVRALFTDDFAVVGGQPVLLIDRMGVRSAMAVNSPADVIAYLGKKHECLIRWGVGPVGMVTREEMLSALVQGGPHYWRVNEMPHYPPLPNELYVCPPMPEADYAVLNQFLDFFNPETPADRDLITAYLATPFWGGPGGQRPLFVFTSPDGKGVGKSTLMEAAGKLVGTGSLSVPPEKMDIQAIVTRMFGEEGMRKRVFTIDNLTGRLQSSELTSLISSSDISGRANYRGEGTRPNTMSYCLSLNTPELDDDLAIRSVEISVRRPVSYDGWLDRMTAFLVEKRLVVVSTLLHLLQHGLGHDDFPAERFRFAAWTAGVLRMVAKNPLKAIETANERQKRLNAEHDEADQFTFELRKIATERIAVTPGIGAKEKDLEHTRVWIQSGVVAAVYGKAGQRRNATTSTAMKAIRAMISAGTLGMDGARVTRRTVNGAQTKGLEFGGGPGSEVAVEIVTV